MSQQEHQPPVLFSSITSDEQLAALRSVRARQDAQNAQQAAQQRAMDELAETARRREQQQRGKSPFVQRQTVDYSGTEPHTPRWRAVEPNRADWREQARDASRARDEDEQRRRQQAERAIERDRARSRSRARSRGRSPFIPRINSSNSSNGSSGKAEKQSAPDDSSSSSSSSSSSGQRPAKMLRTGAGGDVTSSSASTRVLTSADLTDDHMKQLNETNRIRSVDANGVLMAPLYVTCDGTCVVTKVEVYGKPVTSMFELVRHYALAWSSTSVAAANSRRERTAKQYLPAHFTLALTCALQPDYDVKTDELRMAKLYIGPQSHETAKMNAVKTMAVGFAALAREILMTKTPDEWDAHPKVFRYYRCAADVPHVASVAPVSTSSTSSVVGAALAASVAVGTSSSSSTTTATLTATLTTNTGSRRKRPLAITVPKNKEPEIGAAAAAGQPTIRSEVHDVPSKVSAGRTFGALSVHDGITAGFSAASAQTSSNKSTELDELDTYLASGGALPGTPE